MAPRSSFDQTAVLYAVRGLDGGLANLWSLQSHGYLDVANDGSDVWRDAPKSQQAYLVEKAPAVNVAKVIENLMIHPYPEK